MQLIIKSKIDAYQKSSQLGNLFTFLCSCVGGFSENVHSLGCLHFGDILHLKSTLQSTLPPNTQTRLVAFSYRSSLAAPWDKGWATKLWIHYIYPNMGAWACSEARRLLWDAPSLAPVPSPVSLWLPHGDFLPISPLSPLVGIFKERISNNKCLDSHSF